MTFKNFVENFVTTAQIQICNLVNVELDNVVKKDILDRKVTEWTVTTLENLPLNILAKWVIKKYLIPNIPAITQIIFNLLKERITNLTRKEV